MNARRFMIAATALVVCACQAPPPQPAARKEAPRPKAAAPPRFTQLYASPQRITRGGHSLVCYGTENATAVRMESPRRELTPSVARCVEVVPATTTTYTLTAEAADGAVAHGQITVEVGAPAPPSAKIISVTVSSLSVSRGQPVSLCYEVQDAVAVSIEPIGFRAGPQAENCAVDNPTSTTTYVVKAAGNGKPDVERVTVAVK